jgi:cell wall-associated NlpC family hydrolase
MTRRAVRVPRTAIVALTLLVLLLATAFATPASAATEPAFRKPVKRHTKRVSRGLRAVQIANRLTGIPYRWGGASPRVGFDCSGFVRYVYGRLGIELPHHAATQYRRGHVARGSLRAGDLVFFSGLGHVGIYAGRGRFIHAPRSGTTVRWSRLSSHGSYYGARRLVAA